MNLISTDPTRLFKVRLVGTGIADERILSGIEFKTTTPLDQADGLLAFYGASSELLNFQGPKAWYSEEPLSLSHARTPLARKLRRELSKSEWLHHTNPNREYAVPSPTHCGELTMVRPESRQNSAVAVVSNFGGRLWWLFRGPRLRNRFILHKDVNLYGDQNSWRRFQRWPWSKPVCPGNFKGSVNASLWDESQVRFLSRYKVAICLENSVDQPHYFTEKFVNAARAGCIPVFFAHPTIRSSMLDGAMWVDPADFDFDPEATLNHALSQEIEEFQHANDAWLGSPSLAATHRAKIWERIAELFRRKFEMGPLGKT